MHGLTRCPIGFLNSTAGAWRERQGDVVCVTYCIIEYIFNIFMRVLGGEVVQEGSRMSEMSDDVAEIQTVRNALDVQGPVVCAKSSSAQA